MAHSDYIEHLETKMAEVANGIEKAKKSLESGDIEGKTRALGELAHLRGRRDELVKRIESAKAEGAEEWSALRTSLKEEADALADTVEKWLTKF